MYDCFLEFSTMYEILLFISSFLKDGYYSNLHISTVFRQKTGGGNWHDDFHVYSLDWTADHIM